MSERVSNETAQMYVDRYASGDDLFDNVDAPHSVERVVSKLAADLLEARMGMDKYTKAAIAVAEADAEAINAQSRQPRDEAAQVEIERTRLHHYNVRANFLHIRAAIKAGA